MPPIRRTQRPAGARPRAVAGRGDRRVPLGPDHQDEAPTRVDEAATAQDATVVDTGEETVPTPEPVSPVGGDPAAGGGRSPGGPRLAGNRIRPVAAVAAIGGLLAGGAGLYLRTGPGVGNGNEAFVARAQTEEVVKAASTASQRLVSIDHRTLGRYHETLGEFLTPQLIGELDRNWPTLKTTYEQTKTVVSAKVTDAAVSFLKGDTAEVLLVQDVSMEREGQASGSTTGTYLVTLTRTDGVWKLSKIPDLPS